MHPRQSHAPLGVDCPGKATPFAPWLVIRRFGTALRGLVTQPLYQLYERRLLSEVLVRPVPKHIGIILDGNRRYGRRWGLSESAEIYALGASKLDDVLDWCAELAIPAVTLWDQISGILAAVEAKLLSLVDNPQIHRQRVRVQAIGRPELLPDRTLAAIRAAREATSGYDGMMLTIAIAYGGHEEIVDAVRGLLNEEAEQGVSLREAMHHITPKAIGEHLYSADIPDPDLIIRTSGEIRLSGFLLWQSANSEFYFSDVFWPAFRKIDFLRAVRSFQQRNRRFGH
jgi:short-chain Z-isoprenyl diphosphate synthase